MVRDADLSVLDRSLSHYRNSHISYASSDTVLPKCPKMVTSLTKYQFRSHTEAYLLHPSLPLKGVAQFFYVGAQIMCWTFIIQYGTRLFMSQGMEEKLLKYYHKI